MSVVKHFITESIKKTEIDEYLQKKLERAGYGGVKHIQNPVGHAYCHLRNASRSGDRPRRRNHTRTRDLS